MPTVPAVNVELLKIFDEEVVLEELVELSAEDELVVFAVSRFSHWTQSRAGAVLQVQFDVAILVLLK